MSTKDKPAKPCACGKGRSSARDNMCGHCRPRWNYEPTPAPRKLYECV